MSKPKLMCKLLDNYKECLSDIERIIKKNPKFSTKLPHPAKLPECIVTFSSLDCNARKLIKAALRARQHSYCPYTHKKTGAAFLTICGDIYSACNVENVAFSPTQCAERAAMVKAIGEGQRKFQAGAFVAANPQGFQTPCGVCRQFMLEFAAEADIPIYVAIANDDGGSNLIKAGDEVLVTSVYNLLPHTTTI